MIGCMKIFLLLFECVTHAPAARYDKGLSPDFGRERGVLMYAAGEGATEFFAFFLIFAGKCDILPAY